MIEKISIKNFKSHADTEIELGRVTALVGPNGCGKSSVLQAALSLSFSASRRLNAVFTQWNDPAHLIGTSANSFKITLCGQTRLFISWEISLQFKWQNNGWLITAQWDWDNNTKDSQELPWDKAMREIIPPGIVSDLGNASFFKASTTQLAAISLIEHEVPLVAFDGYGLASTIAHLRTYDPDQYQLIENELKKIVPVVKRVRVRRSKIVQTERRLFTLDEKQIPFDDSRERIGDELIFDTISATEVPAHAMSDGTLLVLGLLTTLYGPEAPQIILLDDIEQGLHPLAQRRLIKTIQEFAEKYDKQVLLTTHSGYIVDELEPENVWVMQTDEQGISHAKRLSTHPDAKRLLEVLTTGELADAVGEDWVLPQTPQAIAAGEANA